MVEIAKATRALIHKTCREEVPGTMRRCEAAIANKLEREIDKVCRLSFKESSLASECRGQLLNSFWMKPEELSQKLRGVPLEPLAATLHSLQGLVADDGTIHAGVATFIAWEVEEYKRALFYPAASTMDLLDGGPIPEEAQCMTRNEWDLFKRINEDRARFADEYLRFHPGAKRAEPLAVDCNLVKVAREHSRDTALSSCAEGRGKDDYAQCHTDSHGRKSWDRIQSATDRFQMTAENIAAGGFMLITSFQDRFMDYPPGQTETHRGNVLDPNLTHVGVGVYVGAGRKVFVTEDFGGFPKY